MSAYFRSNIAHLRMAHLIAIFFYGSYVLHDLLIFKAPIKWLLFIRFGIVCPIFLISWIFTFTHLQLYEKYWQQFYAGLVVTTGIGCIFITGITPQPLNEALYVGLFFCLFFGYTFIRLRFVYGTFSGWTLLITFLIIQNVVFHRSGDLLWIQGSFLFGFNCLGMLVSHYLEQSARRDYFLSRQLQQEKTAAADLNTSLEAEVKRRTRDLNQANQQLKEQVTALKAAEANRLLMESQLLQTRKMEAIGRLSGGIAHDFNNILTIINGYSEMLLMKMTDSDPAYEKIMKIHEGGKRAGIITRQLLAFSRKQILQPIYIDPNKLIANLKSMLSRLIGENITIEFHPAVGIGYIKVDPAQLEQTIINLVINAKEAMPDGGIIQIETGFVFLNDNFVHNHPGSSTGSHIYCRISDEGAGIQPSDLDRIFDPFFTTKSQKKGTGLGLSTVYGTVKQSGGYINAESEVGTGTVFSIYLPQYETIPDTPEPPVKSDFTMTGTEKILIVEDDPCLRELIRETLTNAGYPVFEAANGADALKQFDNLPPIDLIITDVIMPEMNGPELIDALAGAKSEFQVLYMSGYDHEEIGSHGILDLETNFIDKPFTPNGLIEKIKSILTFHAPNILSRSTSRPLIRKVSHHHEP